MIKIEEEEYREAYLLWKETNEEVKKVPFKLVVELPNGEKIKLLDDTKIYLGYQVEKANSDRCYGLVADNNHLLVCEYGCNGAEPEIVVYKKR